MFEEVLGAIAEILEDTIINRAEDIRLREPSIGPLQDLFGIALSRLVTSLLNHGCCDILQAITEHLAIINGTLSSLIKQVASIWR